MKWIRWYNNWWQTTDEDPSVNSGLSTCSDPLFFSMFDCEKDTEWREIESGKWNPETGKWEIKLKGKPKSGTLVEAMSEYIREWPSVQTASAKRWPQVIEAYHRELADPPKPPKYDEKLIDELLEVGKTVGYSTSYLLNHDTEIDNIAGPVSRRAYEILQELQRQKNG